MKNLRCFIFCLKQDTDQSEVPSSETPLFKRLKIFSTNPLLSRINEKIERTHEDENLLGFNARAGRKSVYIFNRQTLKKAIDCQVVVIG